VKDHKTQVLSTALADNQLTRPVTGLLKAIWMWQCIVKSQFLATLEDSGLITIQAWIATTFLYFPSHP
jgi:hypothetical protein